MYICKIGGTFFVIGQKKLSVPPRCSRAEKIALQKVSVPPPVEVYIYMYTYICMYCVYVYMYVYM